MLSKSYEAFNEKLCSMRKMTLIYKPELAVLERSCEVSLDFKFTCFKWNIVYIIKYLQSSSSF